MRTGKARGGGGRAPPSPLKTLAGGSPDQPRSPQSGQALDQLVLDALAQGPPLHQGAETPGEERRDQPPSPYQGGEINVAEAIAEMEAMDSVSRAEPNLHYEEDWTYKLQDTPMKKLMEPDPQAQTGEWLPHSGELQDTKNQFHRRTKDPEIERR